MQGLGHYAEGGNIATERSRIVRHLYKKRWVADSDCMSSMTWSSQPEISDNYR